MINEFKGEFDFLSNFFPAEVRFDGVKYPSVENAFQAAKTLDKRDRVEFVPLAPGAAKKKGRGVKLRKDWEKIKLHVMEDLVTQKFTHHPELRTCLISTFPHDLVEGTWWNDRFWGIDLKTGIGENNLGKILMRVRRRLMEEF